MSKTDYVLAAFLGFVLSLPILLPVMAMALMLDFVKQVLEVLK